MLFLEVYLCENSQAAQSEAMSGLLSHAVARKRAALALFTSLVALSLNVWEASLQNKTDPKRVRQKRARIGPLQVGYSKFLGKVPVLAIRLKRI